MYSEQRAKKRDVPVKKQTKWSYIISLFLLKIRAFSNSILARHIHTHKYVCMYIYRYIDIIARGGIFFYLFISYVYHNCTREDFQSLGHCTHN